MRDCMLDIETLGTGKDALVVSIGAVAWDPDTGEVDRQNGFYRVLDVNNTPGTVDPATVLWWLRQEEAARMAIAQPEVPPMSARNVCKKFAGWVKLYKLDRVWANAPTFDVDITRALFNAVGVRYPFHYRDEVCCRTVAHMARKKGWTHTLVKDDTLVKHNALDDAVIQTIWVGDAYRFLVGN